MEIAVEIVARREAGPGSWSFGLALFEQATGRLLHTDRLSVPDCPDECSALGRALLKSLQATDRFEPSILQFCPESPALEKILVEIIPESDEDWVREIRFRLLKLESWHMGPLPDDLRPAPDRPPTEKNPGVQNFSQDHSQWTVSIQPPTGDRCPCPPEPGTVYRFGPDIPGGFCIHAARAVLESALDDPPTGPAARSIVCSRCGQVLDLQP